MQSWSGPVPHRSWVARRSWPSCEQPSRRPRAARRPRSSSPGDAGLGKTRLVRALREPVVPPDALVLGAQCVDLGDPGLPVPGRDRPPPRGPGACRGPSRVAAALDRAARPRRPHRPGQGGRHGTSTSRASSGSSTRPRPCSATSGALDGPVVVTVEDLQWVDSSSAAFLPLPAEPDHLGAAARRRDRPHRRTVRPPPGPSARRRARPAALGPPARPRPVRRGGGRGVPDARRRRRRATRARPRDVASRGVPPDRRQPVLRRDPRGRPGADGQPRRRCPARAGRPPRRPAGEVARPGADGRAVCRDHGPARLRPGAAAGGGSRRRSARRGAAPAVAEGAAGPRGHRLRVPARPAPGGGARRHPPGRARPAARGPRGRAGGRRRRRRRLPPRSRTTSSRRGTHRRCWRGRSGRPTRPCGSWPRTRRSTTWNGPSRRGRRSTTRPARACRRDGSPCGRPGPPRSPANRSGPSTGRVGRSGSAMPRETVSEVSRRAPSWRAGWWRSTPPTRRSGPRRMPCASPSVSGVDPRSRGARRGGPRPVAAGGSSARRRAPACRECPGRGTGGRGPRPRGGGPHDGRVPRRDRRRPGRRRRPARHRPAPGPGRGRAGRGAARALLARVAALLQRGRRGLAAGAARPRWPGSSESGLRWSEPGCRAAGCCNAVALYVAGDLEGSLRAAETAESPPPDVAAARLAAVGCYAAVAGGSPDAARRLARLRGSWDTDPQVALVAGGCEADLLTWEGDPAGAVDVADRAQAHLDAVVGEGAYGGPVAVGARAGRAGRPGGGLPRAPGRRGGGRRRRAAGTRCGSGSSGSSPAAMVAPATSDPRGARGTPARWPSTRAWVAVRPSRSGSGPSTRSATATPTSRRAATGGCPRPWSARVTAMPHGPTPGRRPPRRSGCVPSRSSGPSRRR